MSPRADLVDRIRQLILNQLNIDVPSAETDLIETGLLDSLALVELVFQIEQEFQLAIPLDELEVESFRTVRRIGELVASCGGVENPSDR
jgi:Acyl carrier protein